MDFSKSIYWRGGCPPFARAASPRLRFASFTTPSPSLSPFRTRAPMCLPFHSCAAPPPGLRPAPPRPHTLRATPLAARAWVASPLVPCTPFACVRPSPLHAPLLGPGHTPRGGGWAGRTDPLASPRERGRGGVRKRRAGVARAEGVDAPTLPLACAGGWAGVARAEGWAHRPSSRVCGRGGAGRVGLGRRRLGRRGLGWARCPPCAGREGPGRRALMRTLSRANGAARTRERGPTCPPSAQKADVGGKGGTGGQRRARANVGKGPRAPYLRVKGAAAVNAGDGRSGWVTYSRVPPFRANVAAVTGGKGKRWTREAGGGRRGELARRDTVMGMGPVLDPVAEASRACHDARRQADAPPLPASRAAVCAQKAVHYDMGRAGPSPRSRGPAAAPRSLPSPQHPPSARKEDTSAPFPLSAPPRSRGKGAHEGTSPRPLPAGARRTARPPQSPSAQATPAQPHAPRPARIRERRDGAPTPPRGPRQPNPTCPALPAYARGRAARPAPPRLRTQGEGRCAHPAARATPAQPPAHARGRVGASTPSARATPARRLRTPPRPRSLGDARGSVRPAQPPPRGVCYPSPPGLHTPGPRRGACKGEGRTHAKGVHGTRGDATRARAASGVARRVCGRGGAGRNPGGGAAHEWKGRHIGARVRKGESDGEGVVNEAKRSRGEAARERRAPPAPVDRLRKIHVK
ncbi:hypothetical protein EDB84DRAFT_1678148 [Lactarius hengduanensis]|nr:hypothetical protein EDB84DRAFT_1678148 [Lactarius hengduanensis]